MKTGLLSTKFINKPIGSANMAADINRYWFGHGFQILRRPQRQVPLGTCQLHLKITPKKN
jgi:hypothetical protein